MAPKRPPEKNKSSSASQKAIGSKPTSQPSASSALPKQTGTTGGNGGGQQPTSGGSGITIPKNPAWKPPAATTASSIGDQQPTIGSGNITILQRPLPPSEAPTVTAASSTGGQQPASGSSRYEILKRGQLPPKATPPATASDTKGQQPASGSSQVEIPRRKPVTPIVPAVPRIPGSTPTSRPTVLAARPPSTANESKKSHDGTAKQTNPSSLPLAKATGLPERFSSDSDTPKINLSSRLKPTVAGNTAPARSSGMSEHGAAARRQDTHRDFDELREDHSAEKGGTRVYVGSRLQQEGEGSEGHAVSGKGKGKMTDLGQAPSTDIGNIDPSLRHTAAQATKFRPMLEATYDAVQRMLDDSKLTPQVVGELTSTKDVIKSSLEMLDFRMEIMLKKRQIVERAFENHNSHQLHYGAHQIQVWVRDKTHKPKRDSGSVYRVNRKTLLVALQAEDVGEELPKFVMADHKAAIRLRHPKRSLRPWCADLARAIMNDHDVQEFSNSPKASGGFLIMGCSVHKPGERFNDLTAFMPEYAWKFEPGEEPRERCWVLKHYASHRTPSKKGADDYVKQYAGVAGLLRSMCHQLIGIACEAMDLSLIKSWSSEDLQQVRSGDVWMLCRLFRDLLINISALQEPNKRGLVLLLVESVHVLESGTLEEIFFQFVDFLRSLCNEATFGDLGDRLSFHYGFSTKASANSS